MTQNYRKNLVKAYLKRLKLKKEIKDYYLKKTILVTGGAGAIGINLVTALSELVGENGMIIVLDNLSAIKGNEPVDFPDLNNVLFVKGDVTSDIDQQMGQQQTNVPPSQPTENAGLMTSPQNMEQV